VLQNALISNLRLALFLIYYQISVPQKRLGHLCTLKWNTAAISDNNQGLKLHFAQEVFLLFVFYLFLSEMICVLLLVSLCIMLCGEIKTN
jgi:hypothetical protein